MVGFTLAHQVIVSLVGATFPVLLPELVEAEGASGESAGLYSLFMYLGAVMATLTCQVTFARVGTARASALCVALAAVALLFILPASLPAFALAGLVIGLGYGPVTPASSQLITPFISRRHVNFVFSIRQAGAPLGVLLAGLLLPALVFLLGWRGTTVVVASLSLLAALASLSLATRLDRALGPRPAEARPLLGPIREAMANLPLRRLIATSFFYSAMLATVNAYVPFAVSLLAGAALAEAGLAAAFAQGGAITGRLFWGWAADRVGRARPILVLIGLLMSATAFLMATIAPGWPFPLMALLCFCFGVTGAGWGGVVLAEVTQLVPAARVGAATAALMTFNYLGVVAGPPAVALVYGISGDFRLALGLTAALGIAGLLLAPWRQRGSAARTGS